MSKRRGNSEGSIYEDADGRWRAAMTVGYRNGKRQRKKFSGATRAEVAGKLTAALRSQQLGLPAANERTTVKQFLNRWLTECAEPSVRPKTFTSYSQLVTNHLIPELGGLSLSRMNAQDIHHFLNQKLAAGLSSRTVQYLHAVLRRSLNQALRWDMVPRNVATLVDAPTVERREVVPYTPEEARSFLAAVQGDRLEALYSVAIAVGLRQGEALGLRWTDIDLETGILKVTMQLQRIKKQLVLVEVKTAKSRRSIRIPAVLRSALNTHIARHEESQRAAGTAWKENGFVFTTVVGTPIDQRNLLRSYVAAVKKAGLRKIRFHDLRHTAASLLHAQGVSFKAIQELLGHSDIRTTMNLYAHLYPEIKNEVADQMDAILTPVAPRVAPIVTIARSN
jgi:integrase